jgi:hypothetical protein
VASPFHTLLLLTGLPDRLQGTTSTAIMGLMVNR